jgi:hypothetical protein
MLSMSKHGALRPSALVPSLLGRKVRACPVLDTRMRVRRDPPKHANPVQPLNPLTRNPPGDYSIGSCSHLRYAFRGTEDDGSNSSWAPVVT